MRNPDGKGGAGPNGAGANPVTTLTESNVEEAALDWLRGLGWCVASGSQVTGPGARRAGYDQAFLPQTLQDALARLNPELPVAALESAFGQLTRPQGTGTVARNRHFHRMMTEGVVVEYRDGDGIVRGAQVRAIDFDRADGNDWLAVHQFPMEENHNRRRADIVLFVNGLPLVVIELKNPVAEGARKITRS